MFDTCEAHNHDTRIRPLYYSLTCAAHSHDTKTRPLYYWLIYAAHTHDKKTDTNLALFDTCVVHNHDIVIELFCYLTRVAHSCGIRTRPCTYLKYFI